MINETLKKKPDDPYSTMSAIFSSVLLKINILKKLHYWKLFYNLK